MGEHGPHELFRHCLKHHSKAVLAHFVETHPQFIHSEHPPIRWTKDELATWVVEAEYGAGALLPSSQREWNKRP